MYRLGWNVTSIPQSYVTLGNLIENITNNLESLSDSPSLSEVQSLFDAIKDLHDAIKNLDEAPQGVDPNSFLSEIGEQIIELLIVDYLAANIPELYSILVSAGMIEFENNDESVGRPAFLRSKIRTDLISNIVSDPSSILKSLYKWGTENFDFRLLADYLRELCVSLDIPASKKYVQQNIALGYQDDIEKTKEPLESMITIPIFDMEIEGKPTEVGFSILELPGEENKLPGIIIQPMIPNLGDEYKINDELTLRLEPGTDLSTLFGILIRPNDISLKYPFKTGSLPAETKFGASLEYKPISPTSILGSPTTSRLQIAGGTINIRCIFGSKNILVAEIVANNLSLVLIFEEGSLLAKIFGEGEIIIPIPLTIGWSNTTGLRVNEGTGFSISVTPHLNIGGAKIDRLTLEILSGDNVDSSPNFATNMLATISGSLGPIAFTMDGIGLKFKILFKDGNAGPFDISIDVVPPNGIGLSIAESGIKGGGFISRTQNKYTGIIDLDILGYSVQALAILTTDPDISFLFALFAKLKTAIQLGAGWKLTKIGGMLGVNHTVSHDKIATGIKSGVLDKILFPDNVIENAPTIIANFETVFPALHGQNIFGPAIQIAYGTPTLITADVAVILEFPNPFLLSILGKVTSKLPNAENPIVQINIGIVGALDIVHGKVGVYGSIYDSKILDFVLSGDMAFAASWGSEKNLILSVGGFNPRFTPPSNFPPFNAPRLKRLNLAFSDLVTFECYLALTSNTLQIGARVDAVFKKSGAVISGFLSFDALVLFNPLYYIIDVEAGFGVKFKGRNLASITFVGTIEGPNPHRIKGSVTFSILWWDFSIHVEKTFGNMILDIISSIDPWPILRETLGQEESWTVETPPWQKMGVVTNEDTMLTNQEGSQLIHPTGKFKISQRVVPFNHTLTKFGSVDPKEHFRFEIVSLNDIDASHLLKTDDYFAPGQFTQFSTEEMLSLNSYELMESGIFFGSDADLEIATSFEALRSKDIEYESVLLENTANKQDIQRKPLDQLPPLSNVLSQTLVVSSRSYHTTFANDSKLKYRPNYRVSDSALTDEKFIIFDEDKNEMVGTISKGELSRSIAIDKLKEHRKANPDDKRNLNVISMFELPELPPTP
jgi:hypothetical protein